VDRRRGTGDNEAMAMTEDEWLACEDPFEMWTFLLRNQATDRKLRLFAVACCRRLFHLPADDRNRNAVEVAEQYADGRATYNELMKGRASIGTSDLSVVLAHAASPIAAHAAEWGIRGARLAADERVERVTQSALLRCIFNPFRPVTLNPAWRTSNAIALAQSIYDDRAFDRLPILADALEDAGCDNADILNHCRQRGEHVRGCWVVDLILGRS
jgi:hypothetical protein